MTRLRLPVFFLLIIVFARDGLGIPKEPTDNRNHYELGASLQTLIPNRLPDFESKLFGYGPWIGIPIGKDTVQLQVMFGSNKFNKMVLADLGYRLNIKTPFFVGFLIGGSHILYYELSNITRTHIGANMGFGFSFTVARKVDAHLMMKLYFQQRVLITFGAGIVYLL